jgi:hypothetical protein
MRRIYESDAVHRDDDDPGSPAERGRDTKPESIKWIDSSAWSRRLMPNRLRQWAISVSIETPDSEYRVGEHVPFQVTMKNALPIPVTLATRSPLLWTWEVDGAREAVQFDDREPPAEERGFAFDRGERKRFRKRWDGMFQIAESEWERATPGEYTISAGINVDDAVGKGLYSETTVELLPD